MNMKIKDGFVLREVAGQAVVIAVGEASKEFHGMINLNATGKLVWQGIEQGMTEAEIAGKLVEQYDVTADKAQADVHRMIEKMSTAGVLAQ